MTPVSPRDGDKTITAIERQKKNRHRVTVYLDGEFGFALDSETHAQLGLRKGDRLSAGRVEEIIHMEAEQSARRTALRYLGRRLRSEHEVRARLEELETPASIIDRVVSRLRDSGLIDDRRFAEAVIHDLALRDIGGVRAIRERLRRKGLSSAVIAEALDRIVTPERQQKLAVASAHRYLLRRQKRRGKPDLARLRQNLMSYLGRRGFEWSLIGSVVRSLPLFRNVPSEES